MRSIHSIRQPYHARLEVIGEEYKVVRATLSFVLRNLNDPRIMNDPALLNMERKQFERAGANLDDTFFIRLTAEFEGILKEHLSLYYSHIKISQNPKLDWLVGRVYKPSRIIAPGLRREFYEVRDYRNYLAHQGDRVVPVRFGEALRTLNTLLSKMPDPP